MAMTTETADAGTGDVFRELGYTDGAERKLRVQLAMRVNEIIKEKRLTQAAAAALFGIPQPHVSELKHFKLNRFSSGRISSTGKANRIMGAIPAAPPKST